MNLVSVLIAPAIVTLSIGDDENNVVRYGIAAAAIIIVIAAVAVSKARDLAIGGDEDGQSAARVDAVAPDTGEAETAPGQAVDDATDVDRGAREPLAPRGIRQAGRLTHTGEPAGRSRGSPAHGWSGPAWVCRAPPTARRVTPWATRRVGGLGGSRRTTWPTCCP